MEVKGKNKICNSPGNCCRHTLLEAAKWDFKVRGKCWVLRSSLSRSSIFINGQDVFGGNHPYHPKDAVSNILYYLLL